MTGRLWKRLKRNRLAIAGLAIYVIFFLVAILAPLLAPYEIEVQELEHRLEPPNLKHPLGRDHLGRDLMSRVIYGARISLKVGILVVGISLFIGTIIGCISGYMGGIIDELFMRLIDILLAFPGILLAIAMVAILGPGIDNVIIALCVTGWVSYARLARGQVLLVKQLDYIQAAIVGGISHFRIIFRHILPNIFSVLLVRATIGMAGAIVGEASLSFLGLGVQPPTPSWGGILNDGIDLLTQAPHITIFPGLAIMLVVLGLNFLGDGLRDAFDPKMNI